VVVREIELSLYSWVRAVVYVMGAYQDDEVGVRRRSKGEEPEEMEWTSSEKNWSNREKAMELWCNVKHQLVEYSALPEYLRDNSFILRHYRADWNFKHSFYSMFSMHNETFNIWSHLVGFILFLGLTIYTAMHLPTYSATLQRWQSGYIMESLPSYLQLPEALSSCVPGTFDGTRCVQKPITRWPFFVFLGGAMFCMLASTTCHLLGCRCAKTFYTLMRIDYTGIAALTVASFYPPVYYGFMCNPSLCKMYLGIITSMGIGCVLLSLIPVFQTPEYRSVRAAMFSIMGVSGIVPCVHKIFMYQDEVQAYEALYNEVNMFIIYALGGLVYATRIPERWKPGAFDIIGNSHQLFHVLVVWAAYVHYQGGLIYLKWRDVKGCPLS
jgi:adiponectin receptor